MTRRDPIEELVESLNNAPAPPVPAVMGTLDELMERAFDFSKKTLIGTQQDGDGSTLTPMWTLLTKRGLTAVVATPFADDEVSKSNAVMLIKYLILRTGVVRYCFATETWVVSGPSGSVDPTLAPSKSPLRKEALMIIGADRDGEKTKLWHIVRDASGVVTDLVDEETAEMVGGRFTGLLAREEAGHG